VALVPLSKTNGIPRRLLRKIEAGDQRCGIGAVMLAAIIGTQLFDLEPTVDVRKPIMANY
jgi:hypothetical protein